MVVRKQKKVTKYRAKTTHGGGHRKKRRGAGSRGGRGRAGTGKRASHKKAGGVVIQGKRGFNPRRQSKTHNTINIGQFTPLRVKRLVAKGKAQKEGDIYVIDLTALKYTKLLGTGSTSLKLKLTVAESSARATEKISALGGEVILAGATSAKAEE